MLLYSPTILSTIYLKFSRRHRRARVIIERYFHRMIEQELAESAESIAQRKRTSLIAALVASLQKDENAEAAKREEVKKGKLVLEIIFFR
ncbi:unnamed protein product [Rotaria sp. Silwood1]|nr:unnamed protein product [Rotaria sp. Silwood1]